MNKDLFFLSNFYIILYWWNFLFRKSRFMVFSSLIFIYAFLPLTLLFYALIKKNNLRNYILLIASIIFYTWGEPTYVLILIGMTFIDWISALIIQNACEKERFGQTAPHHLPHGIAQQTARGNLLGTLARQRHG